jgi:hypothetical protein
MAKFRTGATGRQGLGLLLTVGIAFVSGVTVADAALLTTPQCLAKKLAAWGTLR